MRCVADATSAEWVIAVLSELVALHGAPAFLRSDNGAEVVAFAVQAWLARRHMLAIVPVSRAVEWRLPPGAAAAP